MMNRRYLFTVMAAFVLAVGLLATGCLISGQFVIVLSGGGTISSDDDTLDHLEIDLSDDETWQDHRDNIHGIEDIKFECKFINNISDAEADAELWISTSLYSSVEDVKTPGHATRVFSGLNLAGGEEREVSFSESATYIENLETVLDLIEGGHFYVYGIAADVPFDVTVTGVGDPGSEQEDPRFLITFSAGS